MKHDGCDDLKERRSQGTVYRRLGRWYLKYRVRDPLTGLKTRRTEPAEGATTKQQAVRALDRRLDSIADGSFFKPRRPRLMFDAVSEEFLRWARAERRGFHNYEVAIANARVIFGGKPLSELTTVALEDLRIEIVGNIVRRRIERTEGSASEEQQRAIVSSARASCNRRMTVLRRMFNWLIERDQISETDSPFRRGRIRPYSEAANMRIRYYSPAEIARILAASREPFGSFVALALNTGLRRAELVHLEWGDWDEISETIRARVTKGGKPRSVPVNTNAAVILKNLRDHSRSPYIFSNRRGKRVTTDWASKMWRRVCERAGVPNARLHDCRHSFASHLVNRGVPLLVVQKLLGHSSPRMTERYSHLARGTLHEAAEVMARVFDEAAKVDDGLHLGLQAMGR